MSENTTLYFHNLITFIVGIKVHQPTHLFLVTTLGSIISAMTQHFPNKIAVYICRLRTKMTNNIPVQPENDRTIRASMDAKIGFLVPLGTERLPQSIIGLGNAIIGKTPNKSMKQSVAKEAERPFLGLIFSSILILSVQGRYSSSILKKFII